MTKTPFGIIGQVFNHWLSFQLFSDHQTSTEPNFNAHFFLQINVNNFKYCFEAHMMQKSSSTTSELGHPIQYRKTKG